MIINEEKKKDEKYFSVSGKAGKHEFFCFGHFAEKAEAEAYAKELEKFKGE